MEKKVLFVATVVKTHINAFHLPYLKWFQEQGYETHVAARNDFDEELCIISNCDKYYDILFERNPFKKNNLQAFKKIKKIIDENHYDIIHCHTPVASILTRIAAIKSRKSGTTVIYTAHGLHFFKGAPLINWLVYFPIEWLCSFFTDTLITINREDYNLASRFMLAKNTKYICGVGVDFKKYQRGYNRLEKRMELGFSNNNIILVSIGELNKNKNHRVIIEALASLDNENIQYVIAGKGEEKDFLINLSVSLGVEKQVHFLGYRNDVKEILNCSDIFCFPSFREGLSLSVMEAMACELPVVCSNIRGNIDLIRPNIGGFLCDPSNKTEFFNALNILINNKSLMDKMGNENIKNVKRYSLDSVMNEMSKIYCER